LTSIGGSSSSKFHMTTGSSVTGTFTITTFFTNPAEQPAAPAGAPVKR